MAGLHHDHSHAIGRRHESPSAGIMPDEKRSRVENLVVEFVILLLVRALSVVVVRVDGESATSRAALPLTLLHLRIYVCHRADRC